MSRSFRDLTVWQRAMQLTISIYRLTATFPKEEQYGLTNQLRRAAVSIPSNIAEGQGRSSSREFGQFLSIARGSLASCKRSWKSQGFWSMAVQRKSKKQTNSRTKWAR